MFDRGHGSTSLNLSAQGPELGGESAMLLRLELGDGLHTVAAQQLQKLLHLPSIHQEAPAREIWSRV